MKTNVPTLTLSVSDFEQMLSMNNRRLVCVLRSEVLSPERVGRSSPRPPSEHDSYVIRHEPGCIAIHLCTEGEEVFCCRFVPSETY